MTESSTRKGSQGGAGKAGTGQAAGDAPEKPENQGKGTDPGKAPAAQGKPSAGGGAGGGSGSGAGGGRPATGDTPPHNARGLAIVALIVAVIVALGSAAGGWWLWERWQVLEAARDAYAERAELAELREQLGSQGERLAGRVDNLAQEHASHVRSLARAEETMEAIRESQTVARERMERIQALAAAHREDWILAEAGYLYGVARYRTRFHQDVDGALQALKEADRLLESMGAETVEQRQAVADAINALLDVRVPDRAALAGELRGLAGRVDEWPLQSVERQVEPAGIPRQRDAELDTLAGWRDAGARAWQQFREAIGSLVVVRRGETPPQLMPPEESYFLRENLRLRLLTARLALLEGNATVYRDSLEEADTWLGQYFEGDRVASARETLRELRDASITADMPDLGAILPDRRAPGREASEDAQ